MRQRLHTLYLHSWSKLLMCPICLCTVRLTGWQCSGQPAAGQQTWSAWTAAALTWQPLRACRCTPGHRAGPVLV